MTLRRSSRLRARGFPLASLTDHELRHVASFLGPTDTMSLSGSSRGLMTLLANRRAHAQEPWRLLVKEIERAAKLAGDLSRRRPASEREATQMAIARGLVFGDEGAGWTVGQSQRRFAVNLKRTVTGREGAKLELDVFVSYMYGTRIPYVLGRMVYEKAGSEAFIFWDTTERPNIEVRPRGATEPEIVNALITNVVRALQTSGWEVLET